MAINIICNFLSKVQYAMTVAAEFKIEYLQYLDTDGTLVRDDLPDALRDPRALLPMFKQMLLVRVFDGKAIALQRTGKLGTYAACLGHEAAHVGIGAAMQKDDVFAPSYREYGAMFTLRNADVLDARGIREGVNRLREQVESRSIAASELSGYTISLSNFGMFAGRYATPVVVPPCVAIVAAGRARHQMTPVMGGVEAHKVIPLSVTFDHRATTGGEAARFLRAMLDDLALAS
jgi:hypothetical protein